VISHSFIGGTKITDDLAALKRGVHVAVGTPGRLWDLMSRGAIDLSTLKVVVFDEADEMLSVGFEEQIKSIVKKSPKRSSSWHLLCYDAS